MLSVVNAFLKYILFLGFTPCLGNSLSLQDYKDTLICFKTFLWLDFPALSNFFVTDVRCGGRWTSGVGLTFLFLFFFFFFFTVWPHCVACGILVP